MFMQNSAEEVSWPIGIQRVHRVSDREQQRLNDTETFPCASDFSIDVELVILLLILNHIKTASCSGGLGCSNCLDCKVNSPLLISSGLLQILISAAFRFDIFIRSVYIGLNFGVVNCALSFFDVPIAVFTVCSLYVGTLVANRTTAPRHNPFQCYSVLLAALCLILASLTIAARCYASTNTTQSIVQLSPSPSQTVSPIFIKYSNSQVHTSRLVLSRLFPNTRNHVQSDTSVIEINSKGLINQKRRSLKRQKREYRPFHQDNSLQYTEEERNEIPKYHQHITKNRIPYSSPDKHTVELKKDIVTTAATSNQTVGVSARNKSVNSSRVASTFADHQNDPSFDPVFEEAPGSKAVATKRPMPPAHDHNYNYSLSENGILLLVVAVAVLTVALGLVTCVLSHYRGGSAGGAAANPHDVAQTPTTAPMLSVVSAGATAGVGGMDRLRGRGAARELAARERSRTSMHNAHTGININMPPSIPLPDGEEHPFSSRLHIRDTEQESEILQKCIRPPPNRTVLESESPPPYRSSSAGLLSIGGSSSGSSDWSGGNAPLVVRCHSMSSSTSKRPDAGPSGQKTDFIQKTVKIFTGKKSQTSPPAPTLPPPPVVIVPSSRTRRTTEQNSMTTARPKPNV